MYRHFNITALNFISCYSKLSFVQPISLQDLFFPIYLPTTSAIYMINLLVKGNEKTPFRGGLSASLLFLYLADMQSLINFCGLNERGVCICRCYTVIMAIPSFHLFQNGPVSYVKIVNSN